MMRMSGSMEFRWFSTQEPPPTLVALKAKYEADEAFVATWADDPPRRYKVLAVFEDVVPFAGLLSARVDLVAEVIE